MIAWGAYREQIRRSLLRDTTAQRWSNETLLDLLGWAMDTFSSHTALPSTMVSTVDGLSSTIMLPEDAFDDVSQTALVKLVSDKVEILEPVRLQPGTVIPYSTPETNSTPYGFWEWPTGTLNFGFIPEAGTQVHLMYFAHYPTPESDEDIVQIPRWAHQPVALLVAAYGTLPHGLSTSIIRQYADKQDSGNPEHNPLHRQAEHFLSIYREIINRYPKQDRVNYYQRGAKL